MITYLLLGNCAELMHDLADNSIDSIVTDPPYALTGTSGSGGFMGAKWDSELPTVEMWKEALRVAKPGAHLLAFGGTRTYHRLACAIEDAGWEIRDCIIWVYGCLSEDTEILTCNGTCLKPAVEPIVVARKPLEGTVAANVLKYGTGAINIDACRVPYEPGGSAATNPLVRELHGCKNNHGADKSLSWKITGEEGKVSHANMIGRFPANLIHDGSDEVVALFPGSASRFFYCAKASRSERGDFNDHTTVKPVALMRYLVRLVTRKNGLVLDPFMGSGTTGVAAIQEGMHFVGIERDSHYYEIASRRISAATTNRPPPAQQELPL